MLDRVLQAVAIGQHDVVELETLGLVDLTTLQSLQIQPDRSDGSLQFVRYGVDEAIVLFVPADFAEKENGVQDHAGNNRGEK